MAFTVWFTGLPCAGKTTLARALKERMQPDGVHHRTVLLDGDELRQGLCAGLGFSRFDRYENVRRITAVAKLLNEQGVSVIVAAVSPYREWRDDARLAIHEFYEIYVATPLAVCETRDTKGLYARQRRGEMVGLTGVDDPYEEPRHPQLVLDTSTATVEECVERVGVMLMSHL
jgi:adenylylsulfate kinase